MKLLINCLTSLILIFSLNAQETCPIHISETDNVKEIDNDLQQHKTSQLETVYAEFCKKGGTILRLDKDTPPFQILPGDIIFPSCSGGNNRSQTLWNILRPYSDRITLNPPHATCYGFDPYNGKANWNRTTSAADDEFFLWAHTEKSTKFGWDVFKNWLTKTEGTPEDLKMMHEYYDQYYYNPAVSPTKRRIYITFAQNAHIHLYRLSQANDSLTNVTVLFFPLADLLKHPLPEWNTYPKSVKTYVEFAAILSAYLDFSQL